MFLSLESFFTTSMSLFISLIVFNKLCILYADLAAPPNKSEYETFNIFHFNLNEFPLCSLTISEIICFNEYFNFQLG